jgi:hypothetical protein
MKPAAPVTSACFTRFPVQLRCPGCSARAACRQGARHGDTHPLNALTREYGVPTAELIAGNRCTQPPRDATLDRPHASHPSDDVPPGEGAGCGCPWRPTNDVSGTSGRLI